MNDDELYYWSELPDKEYGLPFLFQIFNENNREEYYLSKTSSSEYDLYIISNDDKFLGKKTLTKEEILKVIKESFPDFWASNLNAIPESRPEPFLTSNYGKHTMYVAADYKTIIDILIATLTELEYYYYSFDSDRAEKYNGKSYYDNNKVDPEHFGTVSYLYRTEYNEGYPGCSITIDNIPLRIAQLNDLEEPIYNWVFDKIEDIPCVVEFDYNRKSFFSFGSSIFDRFITPFYLKLRESNIKSVLLSVDNEAFYIKTNSFISENERLEKLDIYSGKIIDPNRNAKLIEKAKKVLGLYWEELSAVSRLSFPEGLDLYEVYKMYNGDILDSTPSSIQLSKLVETEIEQKLLLPFRDFFNNSDFKNLDIQIDLNDRQVSRMTGYLTKPASKAPELGTFAYFLSIVINSKSRSETSPTIKAYKAHVSSFSNPEFLRSKEFYNILKTITTKYRNGSAHTKALPFVYLLEFYKMLIGENKNGFIFKLLDALKR